ncbi:3'-5' ssDNA/RNA exonuclease TatD-like [Glandiceps talaboti]
MEDDLHPPLQAIDTHFHPDRTGDRLWGGYRPVSSDALLEAKITAGPVTPVQLVGGVEIFCDPRSYPEDLRRDPRWKVAIGLHPKHVTRVGDHQLRHFQQLNSSGEVADLGEIGLDWSAPRHTWTAQEELLIRLLRHGMACRPVILHCQGPEGDAHGITVGRHLLHLCRRYCCPAQPLHLHNFTGIPSVVNWWCEAFENCYFGITGAMAEFDEIQVEALAAIPANRLVIETDLPYLPVNPGQEVNTPQYIGEVAAAVARCLGIRTEALLERTVSNARRLYGWE